MKRPLSSNALIKKYDDAFERKAVRMVLRGGKTVKRAALPSWFRHDWIWRLLLILSVILAYTAVWHAGFIWDDDSHLTANPCIVGPLGLKEVWTTSAAGICPLTYTTFWVEHALWGLKPLPYHLVNVLLQAACAVLLWRVLRELRIPGAWLGAALWALHPVGVESVAWITEMKNTQSGLFFLLSILFFIKWLRTKGSDRVTGNGWNYAVSWFFAALAMASKSSTVILPLALWLCTWWIEGQWRWRNVARVIPIFLLSVVASASSIWTQSLQLAPVTDPQWARSWPERLATAGAAVWFYLGKLLWPPPLITIYPRWQIEAGQWVSYLPGLAVIALLLFFFRLRRVVWSRACFFAFAYFIVALLPVLGLIDNFIFHYSFVFDHFQYLASIGPLALAGATLSLFSASVLSQRPWLQTSLGAGLLLILGVASWQRTLVYESEKTLWTDALAKNPAAWAGQNNLGIYFLRQGQVDQALEHFQKALAINPKHEEAYTNLGLALLKKGQLDEAIAQYQTVLKIDPNYAQAHSNLGNAFLQKGQLDEAISQYQMALAINSNYAEADNNFGYALFKKADWTKRPKRYQKALEIDPGYGQARNNLGLALFQKGQLDEAMGNFQKALEVDPNNVETQGNLGDAFFQKGQLDEAIKRYEKAVQINPNYQKAHNDLGLAFFQKGQLEAAIAEYRKALEIDPNSFITHYNLGLANFQKGQSTEAIAEFQEAFATETRFQPGPGRPGKSAGFDPAVMPSAKDRLFKVEYGHPSR